MASPTAPVAPVYQARRGLSAADLAGMRGTISDLLSDLIVVYDALETTQFWAGPGRVKNDRAVTSRRDASSFTTLTLPQGAPATAGMVVRHAPAGLPLATDPYYLVMKSSVDVEVTVCEVAMLLPLPYVLTGKHVASVPAPSALNFYGEPASDGSGHISGVTVATYTVRVGVSNDNEPLMQQGAGPLPSGVLTLYTPPNALVALNDQIAFGGRTYIAQQVNVLVSDGLQYGTQVLLDTSAGGGYP